MSRGRCAPTRIEAIADFSELSYSAKPFLERLGIFPAHRNPEPTLSPGDLQAHTYPLRKPLPLAQLQQPQLGENPPDRGKTLDWPHPDLKREADLFPE